MSYGSLLAVPEDILIVTNQADVGVCCYDLGDPFQLLGVPGVIGVKKCDIFSLGGPNANVTAGADYAVISEINCPDPWVSRVAVVS